MQEYNVEVFSGGRAGLGVTAVILMALILTGCVPATGMREVVVQSENDCELATMEVMDAQNKLHEIQVCSTYKKCVDSQRMRLERLCQKYDEDIKLWVIQQGSKYRVRMINPDLLEISQEDWSACRDEIIINSADHWRYCSGTYEGECQKIRHFRQVELQKCLDRKDQACQEGI